MKELICNRVDYHFARITDYTDIMTGIFKEVYDGAPAGAAVFEMHVSLPSAVGCHHALNISLAWPR